MVKKQRRHADTTHMEAGTRSLWPVGALGAAMGGAAAALFVSATSGEAAHVLLAGVLLLAPIVVAFGAYRAFLSERSKSEGLQFLYSASEVLSQERDLERGLVALLAFACDSFHADLAEVVLRGEGDEGVGYLTFSGLGDASVPLHPVTTDRIESVLSVAGPDAILLQPAPEPLATRHGLAVGCAMVAAVGDDEVPRAAVFVARGRTGRSATSDAFTKDDLRLFETFANHLGTTMEKSRLSQSLAQLQEAKQELAYQAYHDSLTGLANRLLFREHVDRALADSAAAGVTVAVLFIDLDDFKTINDTMGHAAGDVLLVEVARRIAVNSGDGFAARLGGDEFAVLLPAVINGTEARHVADQILVALGDPIEVHGQQVVTQASIGIAARAGAANADELMQHADVAMYTAKRNGKGRFDEFEPTMSLSVARRHEVKIGLERALQTGELTVQYQPVIEVATGTIAGAEALIRWKDPARGLTLPSEFVGVAEDTGLIVPIGRFVLQEACRQAAAWSTSGSGIRIYVNLSTRQLADPDIVTDVRNAMNDAHLDPARLQLEVTETAMMQDIDEALLKLRALKELGVSIAIDDFGTGYSSLSYLRQLPIDVLKIAKPIIDAISDSAEDAAFVRGIIELGRVVGVSVIAEGVERVEQYAHLVDMGCDYVQGYYYAPSLDAHELARILREAAAVPRPDPRVLTR